MSMSCLRLHRPLRRCFRSCCLHVCLSFALPEWQQSLRRAWPPHGQLCWGLTRSPPSAAPNAWQRWLFAAQRAGARSPIGLLAGSQAKKGLSGSAIAQSMDGVASPWRAGHTFDVGVGAATPQDAQLTRWRKLFQRSKTAAGHRCQGRLYQHLRREADVVVGVNVRPVTPVAGRRLRTVVQ
eukprot:scaffold689_cov375-Prasinococcus_capsulatus_cf.AAC.15